MKTLNIDPYDPKTLQMLAQFQKTIQNINKPYLEIIERLNHPLPNDHVIKSIKQLSEQIQVYQNSEVAKTLELLSKSSLYRLDLISQYRQQLNRFPRLNLRFENLNENTLETLKIFENIELIKLDLSEYSNVPVSELVRLLRDQKPCDYKIVLNEHFKNQETNTPSIAHLGLSVREWYEIIYLTLSLIHSLINSQEKMNPELIIQIATQVAIETHAKIESRQNQQCLNPPEHPIIQQNQSDRQEADQNNDERKSIEIVNL